MSAVHYTELSHALGRLLGPSEAISITQQRIDLFAEATEDRQWIHTDPAQAATGPFGVTVAHGYLTLSLISAFLGQILEVSGVETVINYGVDRVRFPSPDPVDSSVRATGEIIAVVVGDGWTQLTVRVTLERDGGTKPVCVADVLIRYIAPAEA